MGEGKEPNLLIEGDRSKKVNQRYVVTIFIFSKHPNKTPRQNNGLILDPQVRQQNILEAA